ncbi:hypothetical protein P4T04_06970 [Bacillus badius]|uniref:hypothetical protein n=1 Tax=Bacillus badius TaxID=1455 RepID=UPI002E20343F|nr:hypothetical protein [Bacillus badius]
MQDFKMQQEALRENLRSPIQEMVEQHQAILNSLQSPISKFLEEQRVMEREFYSPIRDMLKQHQVVMNRELISPLNKLLMENQRLMQNTVRSSLQRVINQQESFAKRLAQIPVNSISQQMKIELQSFPKLNIASNITAIPTYRTIIEDLEHLYEDVRDKEDIGDHTSDIDTAEIIDFLKEFIIHCKKVGSVLNTLNSPALWDFLQKVATIYTIYTAIIGGINSDSTDMNQMYKPELIENQRQPVDDTEFEQNDPEAETDFEQMKIDTGIRT